MAVTMFDTQQVDITATISNAQGGVITPQPSASWTHNQPGKVDLAISADTSICTVKGKPTSSVFTLSLSATTGNGKTAAYAVTVQPNPMTPFTVALSASAVVDQ